MQKVIFSNLFHAYMKILYSMHTSTFQLLQSFIYHGLKIITSIPYC